MLKSTLISLAIYTALIASIIFQGRGVLHAEPQTFILNYLENKPVLVKVFDVTKNDWGYYQAREFSYFLDLLDSYFVYFSSKYGAPHFFSATYYLAIIVMTYFLLDISVRFIKQESVTIYTLIMALYLTTPVIFFSGMYFRTAKIAVSFFLVLLIYGLLNFLINKKESFRWVIFFSALFMSLSDRQGFFLLLSIWLIVNIITLTERKKNYIQICVALSGAIAAGIFYTYFLGPRIILALTGFRVNLANLSPNLMTYTNQDPKWIITGFWPKMISICFDSVSLLLDTFAYFFGNTHQTLIVLGLIFTVSFFIISIKFKNKKDRINPKILLIIILGFLLAFLFIFLMIIKHPPIIRPGIRRIYYMLPLTTLIFLLGQYLTSRLILSFPKLKPVIIGLLALTLIGNIRALPSHAAIIKHGTETDDIKNYDASKPLLQCLLKKNLPVRYFKLTPEMTLVCERLRR